MKKLLAVFVALTLTVGIGIAAYGVDFGLTQDSIGHNNLRLDTNFLMGELRMGTPNLMRAGAKFPVLWDNVYVLGSVNFARQESGYFNTEGINLGLGTATNTKPLKLRAEITVQNPNWNQYNDVPLALNFGVQFSTGVLFNNGG